MEPEISKILKKSLPGASWKANWKKKQKLWESWVPLTLQNVLKPIRKHRFHVSTRTPKSHQNDLQKGALGSQFGTHNGKSALQEVIKKKTWKHYIGKYAKLAKKCLKTGQHQLSFLSAFLSIFGCWFLGVPQHPKTMLFFIKITALSKTGFDDCKHWDRKVRP